MARWLLPAVLGGFLLYLARAVLPPFIVAAVLAYLLSPVVDEIQRRARLPRPVAVGVVYALLLGLLGLAIWVLEVRLVREFQAMTDEGPDLVSAAFARLLGRDTPRLVGQAVDRGALAEWTNSQLADLAGRPADALQLAERAIDTLLKVFLTLVALFYLMLDGRRLGRYLRRFVPPERRAHAEAVAGQVHLVLGRYLRGQLLLVGLMSAVTYLVLAFVFRLPFALPIALASGVLEVVPLLGPVLAGAIAATVALAHGGLGPMLGVVAAYFVLRQVEDQLVMPVVVGRAVHLHPLVPIFAVLAGGTSFGVLGAVLAVPVAAALRVALDYAFPDAEADVEFGRPSLNA